MVFEIIAVAAAAVGAYNLRNNAVAKAELAKLKTSLSNGIDNALVQVENSTLVADIKTEVSKAFTEIKKLL